MSSAPLLAPSGSALWPLYARVRRTTEALCRPLSVEDHVVQSMPDASPTKWHLAHTSWFFEMFVLRPRVPAYRVFDERYAVLFNSYYHAAGERHPRPERGLLSRPTVAEVHAYRDHVDRGMEQLLERQPGELDEALGFTIELGLNHEEQHQELLLTDIKHVLALNPLEPAYREPLENAENPRGAGAPAPGGWQRYAGGLVEIGADTSGPASSDGERRAFAFDNEGPRHRTWLEPFELARSPVSVGEYLEFMDAGGYRHPEHWLSDGWDVVTKQGWEAPLYWKRDGAGWRTVTLRGPRPVNPDEPVCHVSFYEADAFARWKGERLPLEAEWEHAAEGEPIAGNLLESQHLHPAQRAEPGQRLARVFGDVWEWTASPYAPYRGFVPFQGAVGEYNGKWMSSRYVLRGGSCVTPARHIRPSYRNFFGPEARWQFTGIRLARSIV